MPTIRRTFGIKDDTIAGGSSFDDLAVGTGGNIKTIPDADIFWPVTGGTVDQNLETLGREDEVRGRRAFVSPLPFRSNPVVTFPVAAYRSVMEKLLKKTLGVSGVPTGTAPAPNIHTFTGLGFGSTALPAFHAQVVRDDLNYKVSGCSINRLSMTFPLDGEGGLEAEAWGLYHEAVVEVPPTATFSNVDDVLMLRDCVAYFDPTTAPAPPGVVVGASIPDIQGFEFTWVNNLTRKPYAGRNIGSRILGTPPKTRKLWYPEENKLGAAQDVTFAITFGNTNVAQEVARDYGQILKLVVDLAGAPLATTPPSVELVRITIYNAMWTGGGADALSARDDITSRFEGGAFYSEAAAADVKIEVLNNVTTQIL